MTKFEKGRFGFYVGNVRSVNRERFMLKKCKGMRVLHLGCADWPVTSLALESGILLHARIVEVAGEVIGVDGSEEGVNILKRNGFKDVFHFDIEDNLSEVVNGSFDVIVAGEIIEHVNNAGRFLKSIRSVCDPRTEVVISAPNHTPIKKLIFKLFGEELVHPDHICYYSFYTLANLVHRLGFKTQELRSVWWRSPHRGAAAQYVSRAVASVLETIPFMQHFADGICMTISIDGTPTEE